MTWKTPQLKKLTEAFLILKDQKEMISFLRDLCTLEELEELSKRWEAVKMIEAKKSYREISQKTGISTTTITRIAHWLEHGEGGYKIALKKLAK